MRSWAEVKDKPKFPPSVPLSLHTAKDSFHYTVLALHDPNPYNALSSAFSSPLPFNMLGVVSFQPTASTKPVTMEWYVNFAGIASVIPHSQIAVNRFLRFTD